MKRRCRMRVEAKPGPFDWEAEKTVLVYIDMQRDFLEPGGFGAVLGNDVTRLAGIVPAMRLLLGAWRAAGLPVAHTLECHEPDLSDCPPAKLARGGAKLRIGDRGPLGRILVRGEAGNAIVDGLRPLDGELVVHKPGKGAFCRTDFENELLRRGVERMVVGGVTTEVCVQTTLREATDRGFDCLLLEDATASYFPEFKQSVLDMVVSQGGIVGWTATVSALVASMETLLEQGRRWTPLRPGVEKLTLSTGADPACPGELALLRYQVGARVDAHVHPGEERILVLRGSQSDERGTYRPGSLVVNPVGSRHAVWSDDGCLVLINWERPVEFLS